MLKQLFVCLLFFVACAVNAQRSFFQKVEASGYSFIDDLSLARNDWQKILQPSAKTAARNFDSLQYFPTTDIVGIHITGGVGISVRMQRELPVVKPQSFNKLVWSTGLDFHAFRMTSKTFTSVQMMADTTRTYLWEGEQFQLRQNYLGVYNSLAYEIHPRTWKRFFGLAGLGLQVSLPLNSTVKESYAFANYQWNTGRRQWVQGSVTTADYLLPARKPVIISGSIPLGIGMHLSENINASGRFEYCYNLRTQALNAKSKNSEGIIFSFSISYRFAESKK